MSSRVQIVATIGPASSSEKILGDMIDHKMDVARLNFSHGDHENHKQLIELIRNVSNIKGVKIPIIQDLSGPRMKTEGGHSLDKNVRGVITQKDIDDLDFGLSMDVDYVALSYVASGGDIAELRELMHERKKFVPIIAKIERKEAVENLASIVDVANAVMVARGDLGQAFPIEEIPFIQNRIIRVCKRAGKPVIVATQMMLSMTENPAPTRAEVTDVAYAVIEGADAVMLSEETAMGKYPVETVSMMERITAYAEKQSDLPEIHLL